MIKLNAKGDHVEVVISGNGGDISRELHALLDCIKDNEDMQVALMTAIAVEAISEEEHKENTDGMSEILKSVLRKGNNHENLKS
nr:MAG TPA: hypothetical protein [Caudoviricetes sp.]